jgi:hypothetical protein
MLAQGQPKNKAGVYRPTVNKKATHAMPWHPAAPTFGRKWKRAGGLASHLEPSRAMRLPEDPVRPGATPMVELEGDTIVYRFWVAGMNGRPQMLVLRCDNRGDVRVSVGFRTPGCNLHTPPKPS